MWRDSDGLSDHSRSACTCCGRSDTIDAAGLAVAPGFIDLDQHAQTPDAYRVEAPGGITSALEMEYGAARTWTAGTRRAPLSSRV